MIFSNLFPPFSLRSSISLYFFWPAIRYPPGISSHYTSRPPGFSLSALFNQINEITILTKKAVAQATAKRFQTRLSYLREGDEAVHLILERSSSNVGRQGESSVVLCAALERKVPYLSSI